MHAMLQATRFGLTDETTVATWPGFATITPHLPSAKAAWQDPSLAASNGPYMLSRKVVSSQGQLATVTITDRYNNPIQEGVEVTVTLKPHTAAGGGGGGLEELPVLQGTTVTAARGKAVFKDLEVAAGSGHNPSSSSKVHPLELEISIAGHPDWVEGTAPAVMQFLDQLSLEAEEKELGQKVQKGAAARVRLQRQAAELNKERLGHESSRGAAEEKLRRAGQVVDVPVHVLEQQKQEVLGHIGTEEQRLWHYRSNRGLSRQQQQRLEQLQGELGAERVLGMLCDYLVVDTNLPHWEKVVCLLSAKFGAKLQTIIVSDREAEDRVAKDKILSCFRVYSADFFGMCTPLGRPAAGLRGGNPRYAAQQVRVDTTSLPENIRAAAAQALPLYAFGSTVLLDTTAEARKYKEDTGRHFKAFVYSLEGDAYDSFGARIPARDIPRAVSSCRMSFKVLDAQVSQQLQTLQQRHQSLTAAITAAAERRTAVAELGEVTAQLRSVDEKAAAVQVELALDRSKMQQLAVQRAMPRATAAMPGVHQGGQTDAVAACYTAGSAPASGLRQRATRDQQQQQQQQEECGAGGIPGTPQHAPPLGAQPEGQQPPPLNTRKRSARVVAAAADGLQQRLRPNTKRRC